VFSSRESEFVNQPTSPKALLRKRDRPRLLFFAPALLLLWALLDIATLLLISLAFDNDAVDVFGSQLTSTEYRRQAIPVMLLMIAQVMLLASGIRQQKLWARPLALWLPLSSFLLPAALLPAHIPRLVILAEVGVTIVMTFGFALWYFYFRPSVREYYEQLASNAEASSAGTRAPV